MNCRFTPCLLVLMSAGAPAAQNQLAPPITLTLHPAMPPARALKYHLLPEVIDLKSADAAPLYRQASMAFQRLEREQRLREQVNQWKKMPLADLPAADIRKALQPYQETFRLLEKAAFCDRCDWDFINQLRKLGGNVLLPGLQELRESADFLAACARVEMAEGHLDQALRTLEIGFAISRHVGEAPGGTISYLVGTAIAREMAGQLDDFIQQPQAPNLYWTLTDLPRPLLDIRLPLQSDKLMAYGTFPGVLEAATNLRAGAFTPEQVQKCVKELVRFQRSPLGPPAVQMTLLARKVAARHEIAKRALISQGRPRALVEKMPHIQVALLHAFLRFDHLFDDQARWQTLPSWQAYSKILLTRDQQQEELRKDPDAPALSPAEILIPNGKKAFFLRGLTDRKIAALRCLEAIRLHAALHHKLPESLKEIDQVPIPEDPLTGRPFTYRVQGDKATLSGPPPDGDKPTDYNNLTYELTLKR